MEQALKELESISKLTNEGLTHFFFSTEISNSSIHKKGRIALEPIPKDTLVGIVGGLLMSSPNNQTSMPISSKLYLNQIFEDKRATVNHSCDPSLKIQGFNKLIAKKDIQLKIELTIDYGSLCVGDGSVLIESCSCNSSFCRKSIKNDDYLLIDDEILSAYAFYTKKKA